MIKLIRKLIRLKQKNIIPPHTRELQTILVQAKGEVDKAINGRTRLCLVTPLREASWQVLILIDEKGRFWNTKPFYLRRTIRELEEHELPSKRIYDLDVNYMRQKDTYVKIYKKGKIKCSFHFPIVIAERVIGEIVVYTEGPLIHETTQKLAYELNKYEKAFSEIITSSFYLKTNIGSFDV